MCCLAAPTGLEKCQCHWGGLCPKAKRCLLHVVSAGVSEDAEIRLLLARSHHGARECIDAAREAQKAIALEPDLLEAYVLRATALQAMGMSEKAVALLREALSRDPDNQQVSRTLKRLKRLVADAARIQDGYKAAMSARRFEEAIGTSEGRPLDTSTK